MAMLRWCSTLMPTSGRLESEQLIRKRLRHFHSAEHMDWSLPQELVVESTRQVAACIGAELSHRRQRGRNTTQVLTQNMEHVIARERRIGDKRARGSTLTDGYTGG